MISLSSDFVWKVVGHVLRDTTEKPGRMRVPIRAASAIALACLGAHGQDKRSVAEPVVPEVCILMKAALVAPQRIASKDELWVDTDRLQSAINHCRRGQAVELIRDGHANAFLSGTLRLRGGVTLLLDKGVTLYGSRNPRDYDIHRGSCGTLDNSSRQGCHALIEADHARGSAVMGEGVIDGRGGERLLVDGVEQKASWWDLATEAHAWGHPHLPQLIAASHTGDFTVYEVTLRNSASDDLGFRNGNGLMAWGVKIDNPRAARDAGGINPRSSRNITVEDSYIRSGRADIAITAGRRASRDVSIVHNHFYGGDGMSIGAETRGGVSAVLVSDLSLDGPENGIRIQSNSARGGVVKDVTYDDVCIRGSEAPITLDSSNDMGGPFRAPKLEDIVLRDVRVSGGGKLEFLGADRSHHIDVRFDGVELTDPPAQYNLQSSHADVQQGPGRVNFELLGEDSSIRGVLGGEERLPSCEAKFVPFPGDVVVASATPEGNVQMAKLEVKKDSRLPLTEGDPMRAASVNVPAPVWSAPAASPQTAHTAVGVSQRATAVRMRRVALARRTLRRCRRTRPCRTVGVRHRIGQRRVARRGRQHRARLRGTAGLARTLPLQRSTAAGG